MTSISELPTRVFHDGEYWRVDYGSYMDGFHATREEAVAVATAAAAREHRELEDRSGDVARVYPLAFVCLFGRSAASSTRAAPNEVPSPAQLSYSQSSGRGNRQNRYL